MARVRRASTTPGCGSMGGGEDLARLQAVTQKLGVTESVTFKGYTTSPLEVMAGGGIRDLHDEEGSDAPDCAGDLAVGTPVVVYDIRHGPREIVGDGVDGFVIRYRIAHLQAASPPEADEPRLAPMVAPRDRNSDG